MTIVIPEGLKKLVQQLVINNELRKLIEINPEPYGEIVQELDGVRDDIVESIRNYWTTGEVGNNLELSPQAPAKIKAYIGTSEIITNYVEEVKPMIGPNSARFVKILSVNKNQITQPYGSFTVSYSQNPSGLSAVFTYENTDAMGFLQNSLSKVIEFLKTHKEAILVFNGEYEILTVEEFDSKYEEVV